MAAFFKIALFALYSTVQNVNVPESCAGQVTTAATCCSMAWSTSPAVAVDHAWAVRIKQSYTELPADHGCTLGGTPIDVRITSASQAIPADVSRQAALSIHNLMYERC